MAHDVFISHSSEDKALADAVCASLETQRVRCWIAPRDILPGSNWGEAIIDAIGASRVLVLIFSAASNRSPQVSREVERAASKGIVIIPLRVEDITPSRSLEYFLGSTHWLDAISPPIQAHLDRLSRVVRAVLETQAGKSHASHDGSSAPAAPLPPPAPPARPPAQPTHAQPVAAAHPTTGLGPSVVQRSSILRIDAIRAWPVVALAAYVLTSCFVTMAVMTDLSGTIVLAPLLCGLATLLLLLPVRVASRRPVRRGSIWTTLVVAGLVATMITTGVLFLGLEWWDEIASALFPSTPTPVPSQPVDTSTSSATTAQAEDAFGVTAAIITALSLLIWPAWIVIFWKMTHGRLDEFASGAFYHLLVKGTVLELLVAVPTHLWVRRKSECSVGIGSGAAILLGIFAALICFGPALVFLYAKRIKKLQLPKSRLEQRTRFGPSFWVPATLMAVIGAFTAWEVSSGKPALTALIIWGIVTIGVIALCMWGASGAGHDTPDRPG